MPRDLFVLATAAFIQIEDPYSIPYAELNERHSAKVKRVMDDVTVEVMLSRTPVRSRRDVYDFLLNDLPFTAGVVRALGKGKYDIFCDEELKRNGEPAYKNVWYLDDREGLRLKTEQVYRDKDRRIYYTYGSYDITLLPKIWGRSVIVVTYSEKDGVLETEAKVFACVEGIVYNTAARVIKETVVDMIRAKSVVFIEAARVLSEAVAKDSSKVYEAARRSSEIDPRKLEEFRKKFVP